MTRVAGLDGCRGGWVAVLLDGDTANIRAERVDAVSELFARTNAPQIVAIDMPIGLPEQIGLDGRAPERLVRPLLGARQSSVFSIPSRVAVYASLDEAIPEAERYWHCCAVARATSDGAKAIAKQCFHIFPKIVEVDTLLRAQSDLVPRVHECHPEVAFWAMNGGVALTEPKKVKNQPYPAGLELRRRLLRTHGFPESAMAAATAKSLKVGPDDLIDACATAWTALRIANGQARCFPNPPERDAHGLPIAIWA
jgi:predicted RNase H-like nuclease